MKSLTIALVFALAFSLPSFAQQSECDYKVEILLNGTEFRKEDFKWRMKATKLEGKSANITGTAEIIDSNEKNVKNYRPWANEPISRQKTSNEYSPNLKEGNEYKIVSKIEVNCNDLNKENSIDVKIIKIKSGTIKETKNQAKENRTGSEIISSKISTNTAVEAKNSSLNETKDTAMPLQKTEMQNPPENPETDNEILLAAAKSQNNNWQKITSNEVQESKIVYESGNEKAKGLIMIFLLTLSILLNIVLIWKR